MEVGDVLGCLECFLPLLHSIRGHRPHSHTLPEGMAMTTRRTLLASSIALPALAVTGSAGAQPATPAVQTQSGLVYGDVDGSQLLLDVYLPADGATSRPAVLLFYGGGFGMGDRSWMAEHAIGLAEAGCVAVTPDYRLLDGVGGNLWPAQLDDAQRAVRWVRANAERYGVDPDRVGAYGHSSGGLSAAHLGVRETHDNADASLARYSSRVACAIDIASVTDVTSSSPNPGIEAEFVGQLGGTRQELPDAYVDVSPVSHVDADTVPFLLLYGIDDTFVSIEQGRRLAAVLHAADGEVVYGEFAGIDHLDWSWRRSALWSLAFLGRHLGV